MEYHLINKKVILSLISKSKNGLTTKELASELKQSAKAISPFIYSLSKEKRIICDRSTAAYYTPENWPSRKPENRPKVNADGKGGRKKKKTGSKGAKGKNKFLETCRGKYQVQSPTSLPPIEKVDDRFIFKMPKY